MSSTEPTVHIICWPPEGAGAIVSPKKLLQMQEHDLLKKKHIGGVGICYTESVSSFCNCRPHTKPG